MIKNYKLNISYDGTNFLGWQIQKVGRTVQGDITNILSSLFKDQKINLIGSGRTDSGVHASEQIANIKLESDWDVKSLKNALNAKLENDVWISDISVESEQFHSRFSAISREYVYYITKDFSPLSRYTMWWMKYRINEDKLHKCASLIKDAIDFTRFCKANSEVKSKNCNVIISEWKITNNYLSYNIKANRFLQHMVRFLVGTMIEVSRGRIKIEEFQDLLNGKDIDLAVLKAPANGLCLKKVTY